MLDISPPIAVVFILYLVALIVVGVWVTKRNQSLSDYILGGRSLSPAQAGLSAGASDMSGWLLLAFPGAVYVAGLGATWIAIGLAVGTYLNWRLVAPRIRTYTERADNSLSLSGYLEARFEDSTRILRFVSALVTLVFFTVYVASGFVAVILLFESLVGDHATAASVAVLLVVIVYAGFGGFHAISRTHVVQSGLMVFALVAVPLGGLVVIGGFGGLTERINRESPDLLSLTTGDGYLDGQWGPGTALGLIGIVSGLAWGLGYPGQPHILSRFMAIRNPSLIPDARRIGTTWVVTVLLGAMFIGLLGIAVLDYPLRKPETVFIVVTEALTAPWLTALVLTAALAAIISTADSQLLVSATALTEDFYRSYLNRRAGDRLLVMVARGMVVLVAIVAYVLALSSSGSIVEIVSYAWAGFGAAFGPVVVLSLFWPRMSWLGALAGIVTGSVTVLTWEYIDPFNSGIYEMVPGWILAMIAAVLFGRIGAPPQRNWTGRFGDSTSKDTPQPVPRFVRPRNSAPAPWPGGFGKR